MKMDIGTNYYGMQSTCKPIVPVYDQIYPTQRPVIELSSCIPLRDFSQLWNDDVPWFYCIQVKVSKVHMDQLINHFS